MPAQQLALRRRGTCSERWVSSRVWLAMSSQSLSASFGCVRRLARPGTLLAAHRRSAGWPRAQAPAATRLVGAGRCLHRQPELHHLAHAALDGAEVGKARPLGHPADRLADLAAAGQGAATSDRRMRRASRRRSPSAAGPARAWWRRAIRPAPSTSATTRPWPPHRQPMAGLGVTFAGHRSRCSPAAPDRRARSSVSSACCS